MQKIHNDEKKELPKALRNVGIDREAIFKINETGGTDEPIREMTDEDEKTMADEIRKLKDEYESKLNSMISLFQKYADQNDRNVKELSMKTNSLLESIEKLRQQPVAQQPMQQPKPQEAPSEPPPHFNNPDVSIEKMFYCGNKPMK